MRQCLLFLIDESAAMSTPVARVADAGLAALQPASKSKLESVATALNALIAGLQRQPVDVGLVGYRANPDGSVDVSSRWPPALAGREIVPSRELAGNEATIERRVRKVPRPDGGIDEQAIDFPIWYVPQLGQGSPQAAAFQFCRNQLESWARTHGDPDTRAAVIHVTGSLSGGSDLAAAVRDLCSLTLGGAAPTVLHVHLGSHDVVPAALYPANRAFVPQGPTRDLFDVAKPLPDALAGILRQKGVVVHPTARCMMYNARMVDLRRLCDAVVDTLAQAGATGVPLPIPAEPAAAGSSGVTAPAEPGAGPLPVETLPADRPEPAAADASDVAVPSASAADSAARAPLAPETPGLVVFVVDRSVEDLAATGRRNACIEISHCLAETIGWLGQVGKAAVDVAIVTYGGDEQGSPAVEHILLAGQPFVRDRDVESVALRTEEFVEERPDGIGGLISIPRRRVCLVDLQPATACPSAPALVKAREIAQTWCGQQLSAQFPPTIIHLTRGKADSVDLQEGASAVAASPPPVALYHFVVTEEAHPTVTLPDHSAQVHESFRPYWECSSMLLLRDELSAVKPSVHLASRGLVINGELRDLLQSIKWKLDQLP